MFIPNRLKIDQDVAVHEGGVAELQLQQNVLDMSRIFHRSRDLRLPR